ncbi:MAG: hypothetical protein KDD52_00715 [Bdellovibrionales bacterium]|nr:hypothetical protein [Bdellovibrionales bacterium]
MNFLSPGPLSEVHTEVDKPEACNKCHKSGKGLSISLCLDCHVEIKERLDKSKGFHGQMQSIEKQCFKCHPDHVGRDFKLIEWKPSKKQFDHKQTGYELTGAHIEVECDDCHNKKLIRDPQVLKILEKYPKKQSYLGVSDSCQSCHFDEHRGQLSKKCQNCHQSSRWKPVAKFNHQKTSFPLLGKHKNVACSKCHKTISDSGRSTSNLKPKNSTYMQMNGFPFGSCENCHKDVHNGSFGPDCKSCHNENSWKSIGGRMVSGSNFHDKTRYPLLGAHKNVSCKDCHGPWGNQKAKYKNMNFSKCTHCHIDAHGGQLTLVYPYPGNESKTCDACHTLESFSKVSYGISQHQKTRYPLVGSHQAVPCIDCHREKSSIERKISTKAVKALQFQKRKILVSLANFSEYGPLNQCESCHKDIHYGQFKQKACKNCHDTKSFFRISFDHNKDSQFALSSAHEKVPCYKCHKTVTSKKGDKAVLYKPLRSECSYCHEDIHAGQFRTKKGAPAKCEKCHGDADWKKDLTFDHNDKAYTSYFLEGKHKKVECNKCHPKITMRNKKESTLYKPLPKNCFGCHADYHKGEFGDFL